MGCTVRPSQANFLSSTCPRLAPGRDRFFETLLRRASSSGRWPAKPAPLPAGENRRRPGKRPVPGCGQGRAPWLSPAPPPGSSPSTARPGWASPPCLASAGHLGIAYLVTGAMYRGAALALGEGAWTWPEARSPPPGRPEFSLSGAGATPGLMKRDAWATRSHRTGALWPQRGHPARSARLPETGPAGHRPHSPWWPRPRHGQRGLPPGPAKFFWSLPEVRPAAASSSSRRWACRGPGRAHSLHPRPRPPGPNPEHRPLVPARRPDHRHGPPHQSRRSSRPCGGDLRHQRGRKTPFAGAKRGFSSPSRALPRLFPEIAPSAPFAERRTG
jgi:hypothetical protein